MSNEQGNHEGTDHSKTVTIIVNGRPRIVQKEQLSFENAVELAYPGDPHAETTTFTVAYSKGPDDRPTGTLVAGKSVKVKEGMVFNVTRTDRS